MLRTGSSVTKRPYTDFIHPKFGCKTGRPVNCGPCTGDTCACCNKAGDEWYTWRIYSCGRMCPLQQPAIHACVLLKQADRGKLEKHFQAAGVLKTLLPSSHILSCVPAFPGASACNGRCTSAANKLTGQSLSFTLCTATAESLAKHYLSCQSHVAHVGVSIDKNQGRCWRAALVFS